jgi:hypothetical protein
MTYHVEIWALGWIIGVYRHFLAICQRYRDYHTWWGRQLYRRGFASGFVNCKKRCTRLTAASDKVYQLLDSYISDLTLEVAMSECELTLVLSFSECDDIILSTVHGSPHGKMIWFIVFNATFAKKGALDSQPQVIKFTSCLSMVGGSLRVLRLLPPLKLVAMISWKWR